MTMVRDEISAIERRVGESAARLGSTKSSLEALQAELVARLSSDPSYTSTEARTVLEGLETLQMLLAEKET
jgi:hypothetical protein